MALLSTYVDIDAQEFFAAFVRKPGTLPEDAVAMVQELAARCRGTGATIPVAAILGEVLPTAERHYESDFYAIADSGASTYATRHGRHSLSVARMPELIRIRTRKGGVAFAVPDHERCGWMRLTHVIETRTVERLLMADGRPLSLKELPELRGADRAVSDVIRTINTQFAGGRENRFVEQYGKSPRGRGHRRKLDPADELPDHRTFLIHTSRRIENVVLRSADDIDKKKEVNSAELVRLFGKPHRPTQ